jgi:hypothetical protein
MNGIFDFSVIRKEDVTPNQVVGFGYFVFSFFHFFLHFSSIFFFNATYFSVCRQVKQFLLTAPPYVIISQLVLGTMKDDPGHVTCLRVKIPPMKYLQTKNND